MIILEFAQRINLKNYFHANIFFCQFYLINFLFYDYIHINYLKFLLLNKLQFNSLCKGPTLGTSCIFMYAEKLYDVIWEARWNVVNDYNIQLLYCIIIM